MSVAMWNCHVWPQDVSSSVKLPFAIGGPSAKVCSFATLYVLVFKASLLESLGGPSAKVCLSAKCCVLVLKASMLYVCGGSICQSVFVCQVLCTGIKGIYALCVCGGSICQSVFVCQVLCTGIKRHLCFMCVVGPSAKVCLSAKCCV